MLASPLLLLFLSAVTLWAPGEATSPPRDICQYGRRFIDQCDNQCQCQHSGSYGCTFKACKSATARPGEPLRCEVDGIIRTEGGVYIECSYGIVKYSPVDSEGDLCTPGTQWKEGPCSDCTCEEDSRVHCRGWGPCPDSAYPILGVRNNTGCTPGNRWKTEDGCSECVCTQDGEEACTPCRRQPSANTVTCDGGLPACPADCGQAYDAEADCYRCPCAVGRSGDVTVDLSEPCPPGTDFREAGAFFKACAPFDQLPQGNHRECGEGRQCPADCTLIREAANEGCVYCQCGPELGPGDLSVRLEEPCPAGTVTGPADAFLKVCRAPNRDACGEPGTVYSVDCDVCLCQEGGKPACTRRNCSLPKYGDTHFCVGTTVDTEGLQIRAPPSGCPQDCAIAGIDSYCSHCQCGPRLGPGEVSVGIQEPCPPGMQVKATQFVSKTCAPTGTDAIVPTAPHSPTTGGCQHGPEFVDECTNDCKCIDGSAYACTRKACRPGQRTQVPLSCESAQDLPRRAGRRVFCLDGEVRLQDATAPCLPGATFMDDEYCNSCFCSPTGIAGCTEKLCLSQAP